MRRLHEKVVSGVGLSALFGQDGEAAGKISHDLVAVVVELRAAGVGMRGWMHGRRVVVLPAVTGRWRQKKAPSGAAPEGARKSYNFKSLAARR